MTLRDKTLQGADRDWCVKLSAAARGLARMPANAAANRSKRIRNPGVTISFLVPPLRDERHIAPGLRMNGTGLHAGKVGLEPLEIHKFGSALHEERSGSLIGYFLTVSSTVAVAPLTSTAWVTGFPSSLQVFRV